MVEQKAEDVSQEKILNWMDDDYAMEVVAGIKFDPEKEYEFTLSDIQRKQKTNNDGKVSDRLILKWTETETGVVIQQSAFLNEKHNITKNQDSPEKSNDLIKLANALGYNVNVGDKGFHPKNFLHMGMKIVAHVQDQVDRKTQQKTGFSEIVIPSIRQVGKKAQQSIAHNKADVAKWQAEITAQKFANRDKFVQFLASSGRVPEIAPFMIAANDNKFVFA
jgi:hypothetical protein